MNAIQVNNLVKTFGSFTAVDNISFNVERGEIFGFLGANGAGKSTTIKMLCGLLEPSAGDALVGGYSIVSEPDMVKKNIGYMSQRFSLYNDLTVGENIEFFGGVYGLKNSLLQERKRWVLEIAGLQGKEKILTGSLPGGIKQRLALGTAVIHRPGIIFLDEPTSGVDPVSRRNFWNLINNLSSEGTTVLVTTHYLEEAEYCGNIILINAGKLIAEGSAKELKNNYIKQPLFEIECSPLTEAALLLEKQSFAAEVSVFGNSIHLLVNREFAGKNEIVKVFKDNDVELLRIEQIVPALEDVFIHLLEKEAK